jgi:hypothetical protein
MANAAPKKQIPFDAKQLAIFLGIALALAAIFYLFLRIDEQMTVSQAQKKNSSTSSASSQSSKTSLQFSQDQQRKNDVVMLNTALKSYYLEKKAVPPALKDLKPNYLAEVPTDPATSKEYKYTNNVDKNSWAVSATLSDGSSFQAKGP